MKKFLIVLAILIIVLVLIAGYFGFIPGLADAMGANKARDLGVKYTEQDLLKGREMTGVALEDLSVGANSLEFSGERTISGVYTSEIITAMINGAKYQYYPLTNTQVKINTDGTTEAAGNFSISKALRWTEATGGSAQLSENAKKYTRFISDNPSFYLKGKMNVVNNKIELDVSEAQISRFSATSSIIENYQDDLADFVEDRINNIPNMSVELADFYGGSLNLKATYPAVEKSRK